MKNINSKKIFFDLIMLFIFALLYNTKITGILLHEIGGLVVLALVIIHLAYNWKSISRIREPVTPSSIANRLLIVLFLIMTISGIIMSKELFPSVSKPPEIWLTIHIGSALALAILILVHIFQHRKYIVAVIKKNIGKGNKAKISIVSAVSIIILGFFLFTTITSVPEFTNRLSSDKGQHGGHREQHQNQFGHNISK